MANKPAKKVEAPAKKAVKVSGGVKIRATRDIPRYFSDKDTPPIKDMHLPDGTFIKGVSEYQLIKEGVRPAFQRPPNFAKSKEDRKEWRKWHSNAKGPTGSTTSSRKREFIHTLILHRANLRGEKDFTTTISQKCYPSEVNGIVSQYHMPDKHKVVTKYYYAGETMIP